MFSRRVYIVEGTRLEKECEDSQSYKGDCGSDCVEFDQVWEDEGGWEGSDFFGGEFMNMFCKRNVVGNSEVI
jgi:hypothetical protein